MAGGSSLLCGYVSVGPSIASTKNSTDDWNASKMLPSGQQSNNQTVRVTHERLDGRHRRAVAALSRRNRRDRRRAHGGGNARREPFRDQPTGRGAGAAAALSADRA